MGTPMGESPMLDEGLSVTQWDQVRCLLSTFRELFSTTPGSTTHFQHIIDTPLGQVFWTALWSLPRIWWEAINKEVNDILHLEVIEPSSSTWHSPIVLVLKSDGSILFCINFSEVNKVATFDALPHAPGRCPPESVGGTLLHEHS